MSRIYTIATLCCFSTIALYACGDNSPTVAQKKLDAGTAPQAAPLTTPPAGVDAIKRMNFVYGAGASAYDKGLAARAKGDNTAAQSQLEAALQKDPYHFDAHFQLAKLLAATGDHAAAVEHLVVALAGDYFAYGSVLGEDKDLAQFFTTPHGQSVTQLARSFEDEYRKRAASALLVLGRRSTFKWPEKAGVTGATSRGELYAFDRETRRYLRLSHTEHRVAGYVRAPSGKEIALLGYDKIDKAKHEDDPSSFVSSWVLVVDTTTWQPIGKKIALPAGREIALGFDQQNQLIASTAAADGRWATKEPQLYALDKTAGKATKLKAALPVPRIALTLDEGRLVRSPDGLAAVWSGEPPTAPNFKTAAGVTIAIPESGVAWQGSFAVAPTSGRVAFATAVDPCAKGVASSLYVSDGKSAGLHHLLTAKSRFANRWLDADTLAYEDGAGAIRLWDARTKRQVDKLSNSAGIALDVLSLAPARLCKGEAPPTPVDDAIAPADATGTGDGTPAAQDELPPEEPAGPVTHPD